MEHEHHDHEHHDHEHHDHEHHDHEHHVGDGQAHAEAPLPRRLLAEFVGTLTFVAIGTGAATAFALGPLREYRLVETAITEAGGSIQGQEQFIRSVVATGFGDVLGVALAFAFGLAALVYAFGGVSGAHFNPAVTFSLAVARRFRWSEVVPYWVVQCLGAIAGAFVIAGIYGRGEPGGVEVLFGATSISPGINEWQALLAEAFIAFVLVTAIMAIAVDPRAPKGWSGLIIGLALAAGIMVTGFATGGSANFARSLGPFVASMVFDAENVPWRDLLVYAAGPLIGGAAAALVYESTTGLELISPAPGPGAATGGDDGGTLVHDHSNEGHSHEGHTHA